MIGATIISAMATSRSRRAAAPCSATICKHSITSSPLLAVADPPHLELPHKVLEDVTDATVVLDEKDMEPFEIVDRHAAAPTNSAAHGRQTGGEVQHGRPASGRQRVLFADSPIAGDSKPNAPSA